MAINKTIIKNFQYHKNSVLDFVDGLNVIYGDNGQGKSCILRAINWACKNYPSGFSFKKRNTDKITSVSLNVDNNDVIRERNKKINQYRFKEQTFKALRSDIPEEITTYLNLSDYFYQAQHNAYFLFQDSDSEVAKKINKVTGLNIIDEILLKARQLSNENKQKVALYTSELKENKDKFNSYKGISKLRKKINQLNELETETENLKKTHTSLFKLIETLNRHQDTINELEPIVKAIRQGKMVIESYEQLQKDLADQKQLFKLILSYDTYQNILPYEQTLNELIQKTNKLEKLMDNTWGGYESLVKNYLNLSFLIGKTKEQQKEIKQLKITLNEYQQKEQKLKKQLKICPLCNKSF